MSKHDECPWPKPDPNKAGKGPHDTWVKGRRFVMRGGVADGMVLRLFPHVYPDTNVSGWDEVTIDGERYVRPHQVDPYSPATTSKTKMPYMELAVAVPVVAVA